MKYSPERFAALVKEFHEAEERILSHKGTEYADDVDRLENFHQQALIQKCKPADIALTYLLKHVLAIAKAVQTGQYEWAWEGSHGEGLRQRFADARNYLLLLAACIDEVAGSGEG
ncbi:MAG: hypothetical protein HPY52_16920 [Firmicutes bacterium]|nr:hypothetical protein [Bacillota bacterium]